MLLIIVIVSCSITETPRERSEAAQTPTSSVASSSAVLKIYGSIAVLMGYDIATFTTNRLFYFETRVVGDLDDGSNHWYTSDYNFRGSNLGGFKYYMIQNVCAYIFTWMLPFLTNKIGAKHALTISLVPQALLIIMALTQSKTLVGLIDYLVTVFRGTLSVLIVPVAIHVYGSNTNIGARVGLLSSIGGIGSLVQIAIGDNVLQTNIGVQLPVLLAGIMAAICVLISAFLLPLKLKSL